MKTASDIALSNRKTISVVVGGLFVFCQVIGIMCAIPDLAVADEQTVLLEEIMSCPMDGTIMCPPSAASSPVRQGNHSLVLTIDHAPIPVGLAVVFTGSSAQTLWSWSSEVSTVPISIASSSVLRI